jgi:hypothetical protein
MLRRRVQTIGQPIARGRTTEAVLDRREGAALINDGMRKPTA